MIDLTKWIMRSLVIKDNGYNQDSWVKAWRSFVEKEQEIKLYWNEEEDTWFEIGYINQEKLAFSVCRDMPLVFYGDKDQVLLEKFKREYYQQNFASLFVEDWAAKLFSIDFNWEIEAVIGWRTDVIDRQLFSYMDFFYATH